MAHAMLSRQIEKFIKQIKATGRGLRKRAISGLQLVRLLPRSFPPHSNSSKTIYTLQKKLNQFKKN